MDIPAWLRGVMKERGYTGVRNAWRELNRELEIAGIPERDERGRRVLLRPLARLGFGLRKPQERPLVPDRPWLLSPRRLKNPVMRQSPDRATQAFGAAGHREI